MEACFSIIDASRTNRRSTHPQECKRDSESIIDFAQYTTPFSNPSLSSDQRTLSGWFNTAAFAITPQDQLGDAPRASLFGPGQNNFDLSIQRIFPIKERYQFKLRVDMFNAFNHPQWSNLNTSITSPAFGSVTSDLGPRTIDVSGRITW